MTGQLEYILTKVPVEFRGKENWLGYKHSPHSSMVFINEVTSEGIKTNEGWYSWSECNKEAVATIYQRLKAIDYGR